MSKTGSFISGERLDKVYEVEALNKKFTQQFLEQAKLDEQREYEQQEELCTILNSVEAFDQDLDEGLDIVKRYLVSVDKNPNDLTDLRDGFNDINLKSKTVSGTAS